METLTPRQRKTHESRLKELGIDPHEAETRLDAGRCRQGGVLSSDPKKSSLLPRLHVAARIRDFLQLLDASSADSEDSSILDTPPLELPESMLRIRSAAERERLRRRLGNPFIKQAGRLFVRSWHSGRPLPPIWEKLIEALFFPLVATVFAAEEIVVSPGNDHTIDPDGDYTPEDPYILVIGTLIYRGGGQVIVKAPTDLTVQKVIIEPAEEGVKTEPNFEASGRPGAPGKNGERGIPGPMGIPGRKRDGIGCSGGRPGGPGGRGSNGSGGTNGKRGHDGGYLIVTADTIEGPTFWVRAVGGRGGDGGIGGAGGEGGRGGRGAPRTAICEGTRPGDGGPGTRGQNGGNAGDGGDGGLITVRYRNVTPGTQLLGEAEGGVAGAPGAPGAGGKGGPAGTGGTGGARRGADADDGEKGEEGSAGQAGTVVFEKI